jgi:hypothetical protein
MPESMSFAVHRFRYHLRKLTLFFLILLPIFLFGCTSDQNEEFIQGTWSIVHEVSTGSSSTVNRSLTWEFSGGMFYREEEFSALDIDQSQGRYRIIESDADVILLELYDIKGERFTYNNSAVDLKIEIDREHDTLRITNRLFERVSP